MKSEPNQFLNSVLESFKKSYHFARGIWIRRTAALLRLIIECSGKYQVIIFMGPRRSGNHFIINWIIKASTGPTIFYNNIGLEDEIFRRKKVEYQLGIQGRARIMLSFEDRRPDEILKSSKVHDFLRKRCDLKGVNVVIVAVLRDPYNHFASRSQRRPENLQDPKWRAYWLQLYNSYCDLFLSGRIPPTTTPSKVAQNISLLTLSYNEFVQSPNYRKKIAKDLGLAFTDEGIDQVPMYGRGSSFDGTAKSAAELRVFDRWRVWIDDNNFQELISDQKLLFKAKKIFKDFMPLGIEK